MSAAYDDIIEKVTLPTLTTENWDGILSVCDRINSDPDGGKNGLKAIRKRLSNRDPHVVLMALTVLDSCWANCGEKFRKEVSSKAFINEMNTQCTSSQRQVSEKARTILKKWTENECKSEPSLSLVVSLYRKLVDDGISFSLEQNKTKTVPKDAISREEEELAKAIAASLADAEKQDKKVYPAVKSTSQRQAKERKVRALYDFEAAEGNELSFVTDDVIIVTDDSNPHWWTGRIGVQQGLFPSSFVTTDLSPSKAAVNEPKEQQQTVTATINEAILERTLAVLHECDPTGERQDPGELAQLEAASYAQRPLIDAKLASIDRQTNELAQVDIAIRNVLALYDDILQKSTGFPQQPQVYSQPNYQVQQPAAYHQQPQQYQPQVNYGYQQPQQYQQQPPQAQQFQGQYQQQPAAPYNYEQPTAQTSTQPAQQF